MKTIPLILVVDDDQDFCEVVLANFRDENFAVHKVHDGKAAIEVAKSLLPDLILMDVQMPGEKDGVAAAMEILEAKETAKTPIIFLTNLGDPSPLVSEVNRRFAKEIGVVDYFKKGIGFDTLIEKIKNILNDR